MDSYEALISVARVAVNGQYFARYVGLRWNYIFMALLTVSTESALTEEDNSVLTASVFHRLAANFGFCACVLQLIGHSTLTRLAQKFGACT